MYESKIFKNTQQLGNNILARDIFSTTGRDMNLEGSNTTLSKKEA